MYKRYRYLHGRMEQLGIDQRDLAYALHISPGAVSHRMRGITQWGVEEMYCVLDVCRAQPEELHLYFPREGVRTA